METEVVAWMPALATQGLHQFMFIRAKYFLQCPSSGLEECPLLDHQVSEAALVFKLKASDPACRTSHVLVCFVSLLSICDHLTLIYHVCLSS